MTTFRQQSWSAIDLGDLAPQDPLLSCLMLITRYYQNPYSAQSLTARLPLKDGRLSIDLLPRAATRASLSCQVFPYTLGDSKHDALPLILLLAEDRACLLTQDEHGHQHIIHPDSPQTPARLETVMQAYTGQAIQLQPQYKYTTRAEETLGKPAKNWFWHVLIKSLPTYAEVMVASLLINLFALVIPLFTMNVYDRVVPNNAIDTMWVLASGVALVFLFDLIFKTLRAYFLDLASKRTDEELSRAIFEQILGITMVTRPKSVGALANTVQSFEVFREFITSSTITVFIDLPFSLLYILVIYFIAGNLFLVPLIIIPLIFFIGILLQWPLIKLTRQSYQFAAEKQATLFESLSNIEAIKTTGAESVLQSRWEQLISLAAKNGIKLRMVSNSSINLSLFAQQAATIIVILAGVYAISEGQLTTGALIACTILTGRALGPMPQVASLLTRYYQSVNALKSLNRIMQLPLDASDDVHYLHRPLLQGSIEFKQVSFSYDDSHTVLKHVNFKINPGERVAIIGRVGSGKSTLARLILKLYLPDEGTILLDGTDYRQINPDELRQQIGYVPQDVSLFYGSVRENIMIGAPFIEDAALIRAANIAGIGAFTNKHPQGFDRQVGEKGSDLSGGQRQSVAIARALLRNPHVLIFDEPTSAMDDSSERRFKQALDAHLADTHTLVLVTHKLSMLELVHRLIVLDEGLLIADGPKESVLAALKTGMPIDKGGK